MTKHEQTKLLETFLMQMREHIMAKVEHMPEDWNGIELRQYCADQFAREIYKMDRRRAKAYRNVVATTSL